jgi:hypothetical protein
MNRQPITLLPTMTANQIAAWCAEHRMSVTIEYLRVNRSQVVPVIRAYSTVEPTELPLFLRRQGE